MRTLGVSKRNDSFAYGVLASILFATFYGNLQQSSHDYHLKLGKNA